MKKYYDPQQVGSLAGKRAFHRAVHADIPYSRSKLEDWFQTQDAYTLHKPVRKNFKRRRVIVHGIDDQFQADLVDMQHLSKYNSNFKYILTCIDVFSKYAWAFPMKSKTGAELLETFKKIMRERKPNKLQTDDGKEFKNKIFQNYLKENNVHFFTTKSELKASIVERFNKTLKTRMWRYFTAKNTLTYLDVLSRFIRSYNRTFHRSIQRSPVQVNKRNEKEVYKILYNDKLWDETQPFKFKIGQQVRISKMKKIFEKGYLPNWTQEIFIIVERMATVPPVYKIKDLNGEVIDGTYYQEELQAVKKDSDAFYNIEKILKEEKRGARKYYLVKWQGYPSSFNSWVDEKDMKKL